MAERRMFAKTIIDSDAFLDMPISARLLYYDLGMRADDDGFVNSPKKIMKMIGASQDDILILCQRKFIIPFESGIIVIKHWRINNYLRNDRYKETLYINEKKRLDVDDKGSYTLKGDDFGIPNIGIPNTVSPGKDRLGKDSILNTIEQPEVARLSLNEQFEQLWTFYPNKKGKKRAFEAFKRAIKKGVTVEQIRDGILAYACYIKASGIEMRYVKQGSTFFMQESWNDDWTPNNEKPKNAFNQFEHNDYDFDQLEKEIVGNL